MTLVLRGLLWLQVYLAICIAPLVLALIGSRPPGRSFLVDLSAALGFVGLAMLGMQFVITARFKQLAAPYGMDLIIAFHRQMSVVAFVFILAHPALLIIERPATLELFNVVSAPWRARFAVVALIGLVVLVVTSLYRKRLGLRYEVWKVLHGSVAVVVVVTALVHIYLVDHYVSTVTKQVLWAAMTLGLTGVIAYTRVIQPLMLWRRPWEIAAMREELGDAYTLTLRPVGHDGLRFEPGQFVWITAETSPFSVEEHPFSISSSAECTDGSIECTIKALGDWTGRVHHLDVGSRAYVDGPYGSFSPDRAEGPGYVLLAGGIGITPMASMLRTFADRGDRRPVVLFYADGALDTMSLRSEIESLSDELELQLVYVLMDPPEDVPSGVAIEEGMITTEILDRWVPEQGRRRLQYFVCGPPPMMDAVESSLVDLGVPVDRINSERFAFA